MIESGDNRFDRKNIVHPKPWVIHRFYRYFSDLNIYLLLFFTGPKTPGTHFTIGTLFFLGWGGGGGEG